MRTFLILLFLPWASNAQAVADLVVPEITVTGEAQVSAPVATELSGAKLERKRQATIGETLGRESGVSSSSYGQSASRPVIRGQEGDRIKILQNGTGVLDASGASQDHAVAVEPLSIEKVEIVRGPGALIFGSSAVGGVVNMTTNRVPEKVSDKFSGKADSRFSTVDLGRSLGVGVDSGFGSHWAVHADGSQRASDDFKANAGKRIENSSNRTGAGAVGASYMGERGFVGTSVSDYESTYGTIVEKFSHINLLQQRWDVAGEIRDLGFLQSLRAKNSYSHYRHDEVEEGGQLGTAFKNDGDQLRLEGRHKPAGVFNGLLGAEVGTSRFSAEGEEAFVPETNNLIASAFLFEEARGIPLKPSFALRFENSRVASVTSSNFGAGETKSFSSLSGAVGASHHLSDAQTLSLNLAYTERAPNSEELFANGPHAATAQFEVGNRTLSKERSESAELIWKYSGEPSHISLSGFIQDYQSYISLVPTGGNGPSSTLPEYDYRAADARFLGAELEYRYKLPDWIPNGVLELEVKGDTLRAYNRVTGENLPRISPIRESLGLSYKADAYSLDFEAQRSEKQDLTTPFETVTGAYTLVNIGFEAPVKVGMTRLNILAKMSNAFDVEAKNHVSVIKDAAPLPGRNFTVGLQAAF